MHPWFAKAAVLAASVMMVAIRAPHGQRSRGVKVAKSRRSPLEAVLLILAWIAFFLPLIWVASPLLRFADYVLHPVPFVAGVFVLGIATVGQSDDVGLAHICLQPLVLLGVVLVAASLPDLPRPGHDRTAAEAHRQDPGRNCDGTTPAPQRRR